VTVKWFSLKFTLSSNTQDWYIKNLNSFVAVTFVYTVKTKNSSGVKGSNTYLSTFLTCIK